MGKKDYRPHKKEGPGLPDTNYHADGESNGAVKGTVEFKGSIPEEEKVTDKAETIQSYAFRDLSTRGIIDVAVTPNETVLQADTPYAVIAKTNKVIDSGYNGLENLRGNSIVRIFNSDNTQLMNYFDVGTINSRINYLYAAYKVTDDNIAVNVEINKVMDEALSRGYSSMLTQLPFYSDFVYSEMPDPDTYGSGGTPAALGVGSSVKFKSAALLHYQSVLQNLVEPMAKYILTMSLEKCIMNMCYRREAPLMTALYGLLKKKAFVATLDALGTTILADYFDSDWYKQVNTMVNLCSRKSNSMVDPLLTMSATHAIPHTKFFTSDGQGGHSETPYYDSDDLKYVGILVNPDTFKLDGTSDSPETFKLENIIYRLLRMLDVSTMLTWARQLNTGTLPNDAYIKTPSAYYEQINKLISALQIIAAKFTSAMTEVRTFLDKMHDTGMVYWEKGKWVAVDKVMQVDPQYNQILTHVFRIAMGGCPKISWDNTTQRWRVLTLMNKYEGISAFDLYSGGSFLTCSLRTMDNPEGYFKTDSLYLIPKLFTSEMSSGSNGIMFTTRFGVRLRVTINDSETALSDRSLARLDPLNEGFKVRKPILTIPKEITGTPKDKLCSACLAVLTNIAGYGVVNHFVQQSANNTRAKGNSEAVKADPVYVEEFYASAIDPDFLFFTDRELEDVSNQMITFCRNYSPFRVATPDGSRKIGFGAGKGKEAKE